MTKCNESSILIQSVAENENLAMNAEVTEQYTINFRKDKQSPKQNVFAETVNMEYEIQSVHNNDQENLKNSGRFNDIVDKVDLFEVVNDLKHPVNSESSVSKPNRNQESMILTKSTIAKEKPFKNVKSLEDEKEDTVINSDEFMKTRFLLNMEEYKHCNKNLKLTSDWSSEHRTDSHLQVSDSQSSYSPYFTSLQGKCIQTNHRMNETTESSNLLSITLDNKINPKVLSSQPLEVLESSHSVSPVSSQSNEIINKPLNSTACNTTKTFQVDLNKVTSPELLNSAERSCFGTIIKSGRSVCYKNLPHLSNMQNNIKTPRPKSRKCQDFITYGMTIPCHIIKPEKPHVYINSSTIDQDQETFKRDYNNFSGNVKSSHLNSIKQKRSRPSKVKPDLAKHLLNTSDSKSKIKKNIEKNAMKDRADLLRGIKDTKNRHEKLHVGNRKENLKFDFTAENDKQIQKNLKSTFLVVNSIIQKQGIDGKVDALGESVIQCQENIDNNLLCNNELSMSHIQSLTIENCLINDLNCITPEDNVITSKEKKSIVSDIEHYAGSHTNNSETLEITARIESSPASSRINFVKNTKDMDASLVVINAKNTLDLHKTDHSSDNHSSPIAKTVIPEEALSIEDAPELNVDHLEINEKAVTLDVSSNLRSTSKKHLIDFSCTNQKPEIMSKVPFSVQNSTVSHEINYSENNPEVDDPGLSKTPNIKISLEFQETDHSKVNHQNEINASQMISTAENVPKSFNLDFSKLNKKNIDVEIIPDTENSSIPFKVDTKFLVNSQEASIVKNSYQSNENDKANELVSENSTLSGMLSIVEATPKSNLYSGSKENFNRVTSLVQVKRSRGRPRKNHFNESSPNFSSVHTVLLNTPGINTRDKIKDGEDGKTVCCTAHKKEQFSSVCRNESNLYDFYGDNSDINKKIEGCSEQSACIVANDFKSIVDNTNPNEKNEISLPFMVSGVENASELLVVEHQTNQEVRKFNVDGNFEINNGCKSPAKNSSILNNLGENDAAKILSITRSSKIHHSESNQNFEDISLEVKIKRPRGRPKKNCRTHSISYMSSAHIFSPNTSDINQEHKMRLCKSTKRGQSKVETTCSVANENKHPIFEKERTKRNDNLECHADNSESQQKIEIASKIITCAAETDLQSNAGFLKTNKNIGISTPVIASNVEHSHAFLKVDNGEVNHLTKNVNLEVTFEGEKDCESSQVNSYRVNEGDKNFTIGEISGTVRSEQADHFEPNQEIENVISDVKIKKPRGRPKKNQNVGMINSNLESTFERKKDCESSQVNPYMVNEGHKNSFNMDISGTTRSERTDHSEPNQKIENVISNAKVKRPRGRPKKSQNVGMTNSNLKSTFERKKDCESSQVNSYRVNEGDKNSAVVEISARSEQKDHSEPNQGIENVISDVKVKKPRGRPKKNQNGNVGMINISKPLSVLKTVSNADKLDEKKDTYYTKGILSETTFSVTDVRRHNVIYKSERLKNLKLIKDKKFESSELEVKKDLDPPSFRGKKQCGRPRKIPKMTDDETETNFALKNTLNMEPQSVKNNLIKCSHRSRSRKYKKQTNFKLGFDVPKNLYRLNNKRKKKVRSIKTDGKRKEKIQDLKYKRKMKKKEQAETVNSPLEKRKPKLSKRDDFVYQNLYDSNSSDTDILESLLDTEEDVEIGNGDKIRESKNGQKYQNLRNHKKGDVSARKKRMKRTSHNPEFLPSHFCNRKDKSSITPVPTKKLLLDKLIFDKKTTRKDYININSQGSSPNKLGDTSFVHHTISSKSMTRSKRLRKAALREFFHVSGSLLPDFKPRKLTWRHLKDYYLFSPPMRFSPYFKTKKTWNGGESNWISLSVFESAPIDRESCHYTFFTGGPVSCSAWCPTSTEAKSIQYIALAVSCSLEAPSFYNQTHSKKGLLQLWNMGTLHDKKLNSSPSMQLSIACDYGPITDIAWCPKGCWEDPSTECLDNTLPRLGMLAVGCSEGNVRVYSIPHPDFLMNESTFPVYESCPSILLQPMFGEKCNATRKSMCTCLSWQKSDNCERVAAGYANGMIYIWRISNIASFLVSNENNQTNIKPYLVFNAHGTPVTSISFAPLPGSRFLVSSSYDRTLKFWDLLDISLPFFTIKKGPARCAEWANHFCGVFASLDNGMNCLRGSCFFKESGTESFPAHSLSNPSCFVTRSTMSEYLEAQASVDISGSASVNFFYDLINRQKAPLCFHRPVYLTEIVAVEGILDKIAFSSYPESRDCLLAIQDMKDIVTLMNEATEMFGRKSLDADSVDKSEEHETERSCSGSISSENILKSKCSNLNTGNVHYINVTNELITVKSVSKLCDTNNNTSKQSNNCFPLIQTFEDKYLNENVDQLMLFGENGKFNSENQIFLSDEKITDLLLCDSSSLDSSISSSHFSSQSDRSSSSDLETVDHELNITLGSLTLASEFSQISSCDRKDKCANFESDSISPIILDPENVVASQNDKSAKIETSSTSNEEIMPGSRTALITSENPLPTSNELNKMEIVDTSVESATVNNISLEENKNECSVRVLDNTVFTNSSQSLHTYAWNSNDIFSVNKLCDINSGCHKVSKNHSDISHVALTDNTENVNTKHACIYLEKTCQSDCNIVKPFPKPQKKNFYFKTASKPIVTSDYSNDNKGNRNITTNNQLCDKNPPPSISSSYETVISHYGLVFKDMDTVNFKSIEDIKVEDNSLHDSYNIASLKTAAWNPNYGSHCWLFSAGQSGLARISYISEMDEFESFPSMGSNN